MSITFDEIGLSTAGAIRCYYLQWVCGGLDALGQQLQQLSGQQNRKL